MGLSAPKKRIKLSHDPNNTTWTNDTQSFGHKIMTSQGWAPGQYLGAQDAAHAEFHTAANASHIRVTIKDDNLGLGAKIGSGVGHGECTGLDVFKNILGRLNGQDEEELEKEQKSRDDLKRAIYTERRWGSIRFVQGGFLIGDKIQHLIDGEAERLRKLADGSSSDSSDSDTEEVEEEASAPVEKSKKSKKRKIEAVEGGAEVVAVKVKRSKRKSKIEGSAEEEVAVILSKLKMKKSKADRKPKEETEETSDDAKSRRRQEKKDRKREREEKRERKEKKKSKSDPEDAKKSKKEKKAPKSGSAHESSNSTTKENTPSIPTPISSSGRSTPMMQGRHAVRSRNIAQKRLASMDVASLNQIFMIKS